LQALAVFAEGLTEVLGAVAAANHSTCKSSWAAKSENRGVICETKVSKNHRNFAA